MDTKNMNIHTCGNVKYLTAPVFESMGFIKHAFSTRYGGVTEDRYLKEMNLGLSTSDDIKNVIKNYEIFCASAGMNAENVVISAQKHGDVIREVKMCDAGKGVYRARDYDNVDALVTNEKGLILTVHTADCVPILFADPLSMAIGAAHCGWRGTYASLAAKTAEKMHSLYGSRFDDVMVCIGPCIHMCCYEVSRELYLDFINKFPYVKNCTKHENENYFLNLAGINAMILKNCGIKEENIFISDLCTCCNKDELFSHRGYGGKRGIMAAMIEISK